MGGNAPAPATQPCAVQELLVWYWALGGGVHLLVFI